MRCVLPLLCILLLVAPAEAKKKQKPQTQGGSPALEVVPLVDLQAPLVVVWFVADSQIPLDDASAVENQVFEDFQKRMDVRILSREKTLDLLGKVNDPTLQECKGGDYCLVKIGKALETDRVVGVIMEGTVKNYRIILKSFDLKPTIPRQLNSVVEGSLTELLVRGAAASAIAAALENIEQYAPVDLMVLAREAQTKPSEPPPRVPLEMEAPGPEKVRAAVDVEPASKPKVLARAPARPGFFSRHLWSTVALGTGVVMAGAGIAFGMMSQDARDDVSWPGGTWDPARDAWGKNSALAANILFGVGGAAAVTSVVLFFFFEDEPEEAAGLVVLPSYRGLEARIRF